MKIGSWITPPLNNETQQKMGRMGQGANSGGGGLNPIGLFRMLVVQATLGDLREQLRPRGPPCWRQGQHPKGNGMGRHTR